MSLRRMRVLKGEKAVSIHCDDRDKGDDGGDRNSRNYVKFYRWSSTTECSVM